MVAVGASLTDIECQIDFCVGKSRDRVHNWLDAEEDEEINFTRYKITFLGQEISTRLASYRPKNGVTPRVTLTSSH